MVSIKNKANFGLKLHGTKQEPILLTWIDFNLNMDK